MKVYETLRHTTWECKCHVVFISKCRRKTLYGQIRQELGRIFRELAEQKESEIEEGHLMPDHVHMLISAPPKYSVAQVMGYIKGKSAIHIARVYAGRRRNFVGQHFWARGYWVIDGRKERSCCASLHPGSGERRSAAGAKWNWRRFERLPITINRFERFTLFQASGFAGGL